MKEVLLRSIKRLLRRWGIKKKQIEKHCVKEMGACLPWYTDNSLYKLFGMYLQGICGVCTCVWACAYESMLTWSIQLSIYYSSVGADLFYNNNHKSGQEFLCNMNELTFTYLFIGYQQICFSHFWGLEV